MKVTLRKAHKLQQKINDFLSTQRHSFDCSVSASMYSADAMQDIRNSRDEYIEALTRVKNGMIKLRTLRSLVQAANASVVNDDSINSRISSRKLLKDINRMVSTEIDNTSRHTTSDHELKGKLAALQAGTATDGYGSRSTSISASALTAEALQALKDEFDMNKRHIETLDDELLELNMTTTIQLPTDVTEFLEEFKLV